MKTATFRRLFQAARKSSFAGVALICLLGGLLFAAAPGDNPPEAQDAPPSLTQPARPVAELLKEIEAQAAKAESDEALSAVIELCDQVLAGTASDVQQKFAHDMLGWALNRRGQLRAESRPEEALSDFEASLKHQPGQWRALYNRAISYAQAGKLAEAQADLDKVVQAQPGFFKGLFNRAEVKFARGDIAGSLPDYNAALRLEPQNTVALNARGFARSRLRDFQGALNDFHQLIALDSQDVSAYVNRGDALAETGQYGPATQDYSKAIELDPKATRAYLSWSWLMATCPREEYRNADAALSYARYAVKGMGGDDYHYLDVLAAALANAGQFDEARQTQEKALALTPENERAPLRRRLDLYAGQSPFRNSAPIIRAQSPFPTPAFNPLSPSSP